MASSKKVGGKVIHLRESVGTNGEAKNFAKDTTSFRTASLLKSCYIHVPITKIQGNLGNERAVMMTFSLISTFIQVLLHCFAQPQLKEEGKSA